MTYTKYVVLVVLMAFMIGATSITEGMKSKQKTPLTSEQCNYNYNMSTELDEGERLGNLMECNKNN
jgi:hypothetical protein